MHMKFPPYPDCPSQFVVCWLSSMLLKLNRPAQYGLRTIDYSQQPLSFDEDARKALGKKLCAIGELFESTFNAPQDIEGCMTDGEIVIVQSRSQD